MSNSEMTGPAVLFALNIFRQPLPEHRMAEWYSLEGLAARVGLESQAVSVVREGFKRAFGKALAVMGRGGEVNDHFDGALVSKEAAVQFILLKWTGKMGVCSLLTLAPHVAPHVAPDPLVGAPVEEPCLDSEIRCDIDHFAGASSVAEGAPVVTADADSYHSQAPQCSSHTERKNALSVGAIHR